MNRLFLLLTLFGCSLYGAYSQSVAFNVAMDNFFDNREYFNKYVAPQTMGGTNFMAAAGFIADDKNSFYGGINYLFEYGSDPQTENISPVVYFRHTSSFAKLYMGAFPRKNLIQMPLVLITDTFRYYRPLAEGIYTEFTYRNLSQSAWLDWTSRQTNTDRETFLIGGTGKYTPGAWFARYDFIMYHYAGTAIDDPNDHIRDNGGLSACVGLNIMKFEAIDSFTVSTGFTMSYDRLRNMYDTDYRFGSISEVFALYRVFGIRNALYFGEGQTQMVGDGLYSAKFYNRTDFIFKLFPKSRVKSSIEFSLHMLPEVLDVSQRITVYIDLNGRKALESSAKE